MSERRTSKTNDSRFRAPAVRPRAEESPLVDSLLLLAQTAVDAAPAVAPSAANMKMWAYAGFIALVLVFLALEPHVQIRDDGDRTTLVIALHHRSRSVEHDHVLLECAVLHDHGIVRENNPIDSVAHLNLLPVANCRSLVNGPCCFFSAGA